MRDATGDGKGEKSGLAVGDKNKIDMPHHGRWTVRGQERLPLPHPLSFFLAAPESPKPFQRASNGMYRDSGRITRGFYAFFSFPLSPFLVSFFPSLLLRCEVGQRDENKWQASLSKRRVLSTTRSSNSLAAPLPVFLCVAHNCAHVRVDRRTQM